MTGSRFYESSVYGCRAGSISSTTHTGVSAHQATQATQSGTNQREEQQQCCAAGGKGMAGLHLSLHPTDQVPPTDCRRSSLVSQDLLLFNDHTAAGLTKMARPRLSVCRCHSQQSSALQTKELSPAQGSTAGFPRRVEQNGCPLARAEL